MINILLCLVVALVIAAAVLGVVRAALALEPLASVRPFGGLLYALIVLLIVLVVVQYCFGGLHDFRHL